MKIDLLQMVIFQRYLCASLASAVSLVDGIVADGDRHAV
jgi:hypothetical protein